MPPLPASLLFRLLVFTLIIGLLTACQNDSSTGNEAAGQIKQDSIVEGREGNVKAITGTSTKIDIPLYILYVDTAEFKRKLIFKDPVNDTTRRLVFKFHFLSADESTRLTMGIWPAEGKKFLKSDPPVILNTNSRYDTTITDPLFLGDQQIKRGQIMRLIRRERGKYLVFRPVVVRKGSYKYLTYRIYCSNTFNKFESGTEASLLLAFEELDPSPPAVQDEDLPNEGEQ